MCEGKPSIWRSENEFRDTEIRGGFLRRRGTTEDFSEVRLVPKELMRQISRIKRIFADHFNGEVRWADGFEWEVVKK